MHKADCHNCNECNLQYVKFIHQNKKIPTKGHKRKNCGSELLSMDSYSSLFIYYHLCFSKVHRQKTSNSKVGLIFANPPVYKNDSLVEQNTPFFLVIVILSLSALIKCDVEPTSIG